ncbi:MAG TPA: DUF6702 family protein, partial [Sediminibacterium sp.]|nr:DUF6702 family protein [Sediminibacterium sp.]
WMMAGMLSLFHPFFVYFIEINHNTKNNTAEISVRTFAQDLETALQKYTAVHLDIDKPADMAFLDKQIAAYLTQRIKLRINGQPVTPRYLGHEVQMESVWSYLEVPGVRDMKSLDINCTLLYDFETRQSNIIHIKNGTADKSYKLDYPNNHTLFKF